MNPKDENKDRARQPRTDPQHEEPRSPEQTAPPIEREHETYAGVLEEDERRERERK